MEKENRESLKNSLQSRLLKLECHFTWELLEEDCDVENTEERLSDQIEFSPPIGRHRIYNLLAYVKYLKGENEEAFIQLQRASENLQETTSDDTDIKWAVTYANYAWLCHHTDQIIKVYKYLKKAETIIKKTETSPSCKILLNDIYEEEGWCLLTYCIKYYERAQERFEKALEVDPDNPELNSGYATAVYRLEGFRGGNVHTDEWKSVELLKKAVQLNPNDTVVKALLALKYKDLNDTKAGGKLVEEALAQTPDLPNVLRYAATFYQRENMNEEAIRILKKALTLTPTSASLHHQIGKCSRKMIKAMKESAYIPRLNGQPTNTYTRQKYDLIGHAIFHYEKSVEIKKPFVSAHLALAHMYARGHQYQRAEETFQKVLGIENTTLEDQQEIQLSLGHYKRFHKRQEFEAIRHYKQVLIIPNPSKFREYAKKALKELADKRRGYSSDSTGLALLAFIHQQDGEIDKAVDYYDQALKMDPDNEEYLSALCDLKLKYKLYDLND